MPKNKNLKISIIGAGPAGCFSGYLLAKTGFDVEIYEQKKKNGKIECGGLVTQKIKEIDKIFRTKEFKKTIINKTKKVKLYSENNSLILNFKKPEFILDRIKFDNFLAEKAKNAGAKINMGNKFLNFQRERGKIILKIKTNQGLKNRETDLLIGADGVKSTLAKLSKVKRNIILAIEARCLLNKKTDRDAYTTFFDKNISPSFYAWSIPENSKIARIGLAESLPHFQKLLRKLKAKILDIRSGFLSIDKPKRCQFDNVYLVGDAGGHVKASTGGGIIFSLLAAKILAESLIKKENFDKNLKSLNRTLYLHYLIRKYLDKFTNKDYDALLSKIKNPKIKKMLETFSREEPLEFKKIILKKEFVREFLPFALKFGLKRFFYLKSLLKQFKIKRF